MGLFHMDFEADPSENVRTKQPILCLCGLGESIRVPREVRFWFI